MPPFDPIVSNPHLLTIFGNYWPRRYPEQLPVKPVVYKIGEEAQVLVHEHATRGPCRGEIVMIHGLEGSSDAGYMRSMAQAAVAAGFAVHRTNIRGCGGTESTCRTLYHAGLTCDILHILRELERQQRGPAIVIGFSLGGNQVLKLAGELCEDAARLIAGVCAVSTPIDLAACVRALGRPQNFLYEWRFVSRMRERMKVRQRLMPDVFRTDGLESIRTVYDFDDRITAQFFGFGGADNYYATQSSQNFLDRIRVPTLLVAAEDDPLVPFEVYSHQAVSSNPSIELVSVAHGGHLGFISARRPRFWLDGVVLDWAASMARTGAVLP